MFLHHEQVELGDKFEEFRARELYRRVPVGETKEDRIRPTDLLHQLEQCDPKFWNQGQMRRYVEELKKKGLLQMVQGGGIFRSSRRQSTFSERHLYAPMITEIETGWVAASHHKYLGEHNFCEVLDTSEGGRRPDGSWRRPDITLVGGREIPYVPGNFIDVVTFEVKKDDLPLMGVYEAFSHQRAANYSYVVYWFPQIWGRPNPQRVAEIQAEAQRCGVGVILAGQEDDYGLWQELVRPKRIDPDPQVIEDFLTKQCSAIRDNLLTWINRGAVVHPPIEGPPTDEDFTKLQLSKEEQQIARAMYDKLRDSGKGWTHFRRSLASPLEDSVIRRVRNAMRDMGFIRTSQGGGLYVRHTD